MSAQQETKVEEKAKEQDWNEMSEDEEEDNANETEQKEQ